MKKIVSILLAALVLATLVFFYFRTNQRDGKTSSQTANTSRNDDSAREPYVLEDGSRAATSKTWASDSSEQIDRLFHDTKNKAESGDPVAQRELAQIYERCFMYSLSPKNLSGMVDSFAKADPENAARYAASFKRLSHYCDSLDNGKKIPLEAFQLWYAEAARRGDLIAQIKVASTPDSGLSEAAYGELIAKAFESKDPDAIFALGDLLALAKTPVSFGDYAHPQGGDYSEHSWEIAACRAGAECGPGSFRIDSGCLSGMCNASNYESLIKKNFIPPAQLKFLERDVEHINFLLRQVTK
ncbi:hypothetical protein M3O57_07310 [Xanthomonas nasturtii]|uniref:hypothetical protein n=1 Tax=Xanthomonas nasturtii TaxID=1843581 RepID=UPI0011C06673|nr:hypothetical protein [Xanthomonas nasturtii]MCL1530155.1 hypothetical protein [Xanthomonas nasturtii]MCL1559911.1 hypothetical protein [Xanthomonas nasturtii]MCL1564877.1 hypothetical protein [Xanthomonas nasturtii]MCL1569075.1 hypothetical protein [Xanthomonas nasturtii]MCL1572832.1 hypothetical protein [Xanthomonas nasturtii]